MINNNKKQIISLKDFEELAKNKLDKSTIGYYSAGADDQFTLNNNINAFKRISLLPRVLKDISKISMETSILGQSVKLPFGVAPVAMQKLLHPEGQVLLARQAYKQGTIYNLSMLSTTQIKDITAVNPSGFKMHQVYLLKSSEYTQKFVKLVQKHGFQALAITVDTQTFGKRRIDQYNKFQPDVELQIFKQLGLKIKFKSLKPQESFVYNISTKITWSLIQKLKQLTKMKIILKGVVDPEDIPLAEQIGVDAIWISNHGGRQLDTAPATIQALPGIKNAMIKIKSKMEIYIDGGIRKGSDIFKCLALGADFVFLGRGFLYSLIRGEQGVHQAFQILKKQLYTTMALCGTISVNQITNNYVRYQQAYSRL